MGRWRKACYHAKKTTGTTFILQRCCIDIFLIKAVLWIWNDLVRIGILPFTRGIDKFEMNLYGTVHNGTAVRLFKNFRDFMRKFKCNERQMGPFWGKICKNYTDCPWQKDSGVRTAQKVQAQTGSRSTTLDQGAMKLMKMCFIPFPHNAALQYFKLFLYCASAPMYV